MKQTTRNEVDKIKELMNQIKELKGKSVFINNQSKEYNDIVADIHRLSILAYSMIVEVWDEIVYYATKHS